MAGEDELFQMDLNLHPNEASGLLTIGDEGLLGEHGWDLGFWAVLDEGEISDCVAAIGHRRGSPEDEGWEIERLHAEVDGDAGKTEDAEAITRDEGTGYVYILGSHFGSKSGPLQPKRGFVARFREADVGRVTEDPAMPLGVSRRSFALHRLINDAIDERGLDLIPLGERSHEALIEATIERGEKEKKKWAGLVRGDDYPINIEGAAFRDRGNPLPLHPSRGRQLRGSRSRVRPRVPEPSARGGDSPHPRRPHLLRHRRGRGRAPAAHPPAGRVGHRRRPPPRGTSGAGKVSGRR